jgi:gamma-glutamylcyclotransferase (GGCT)/AIG2-like uncharacterized protein YtfP
MFPQIWSQVADETYQTIAARLYGFKRRLMTDGTYPTLIQGKNSDYIDGIVYLNVSLHDMRKLDTFEGYFHKKEVVECQLPDNSFLTAYVYVLKPKYSHMTQDKDWDPDQFAETVITPFFQDSDNIIE